MVFSAQNEIVSIAQHAFKPSYPDDVGDAGDANVVRVEHDPEQIWRTTLDACKQAIASAAARGTIAAVGIANQRETTLIWDRQSGKPIYNAIVWQDRRTAAACEKLARAGVANEVADKTGLLLDPYFSATKIGWILDNVAGARQKAQSGRLAFGTVDTYLIWRLTGGKRHLTDATNASRTLLFNIHSGTWDTDLLRLFNVPQALLPEVKNCADDFGVTDKAVLGVELAIAGVAGDQQAALIGQTCFKPGMVKSTYGTGCFMMMNTGHQPMRSRNKLLTTIGYRLGDHTTYALEGAIFNAGTAVQWLRDGLGIIQDTNEIDRHLQHSEARHGRCLGVYMVPAFTGLGAPHWNTEARGMVSGLTRDASASDLVRAAIESVCYQTHDLLGTMLEDSGLRRAAMRSDMRVDGGMAANDWLLQFLSDITQSRIRKPTITETTALGAAYLAGLQIGLFESIDDLAKKWRQEKSFEHEMDAKTRQRCLDGWRKAVQRCLL